MSKRLRKYCRGLLAIALCGCAAAAVGCQAFGMAAYLAESPEVKAVYTPPKTPMLILVENGSNPGMFVAEASQLTAFIADDLEAYQVAPLIEREKVQEFFDARKDLQKLTITQIGRELGAAQVLYVDIRTMSYEPIQGIAAHGRVDAQVRVVDVATGRTTFPAVAEGWPISVETGISEDLKGSDLAGARTGMLRVAGTKIGRLFHKYIPG